MKELLTPKQVAQAIQVSESSVKRWCDKGAIRTQYTAGGHRRIPLNGLLTFLRSSKHELIQPELLGLPVRYGSSFQTLERAAATLTDALVAGNEELCRQIVMELYLAEHSLSAICDLVFAAALNEIGDRWECGSAEVYQERRSCEISLRLLHELRSFVPVSPVDAPLAIGGSIEGDVYSMPTTMVELVLRDTGWCAVSLGNNLPFDTLTSAIRQNRPKLFWLSVSHIEDVGKFLAGYNELYDEFGREVPFVVGGRCLTAELREQMGYAAHCDNLRHLEGLAQTFIDQEMRLRSESERASSLGAEQPLDSDADLR